MPIATKGSETALPNSEALPNDAEPDAALARIRQLLESVPDAREYAELKTLSDLAAAYEKIHYPSAEPTSAGRIQDRLDAYGMSEDALIPSLGSRERVAAVLVDRQSLTPPEARAPAARLGLKPELLLPPRP